MLVVIGLAAILAGGIASISGFGIGSVLTPAMAGVVSAETAVAAVSIPHAIATAYRLWLIREHVDLKLLRSFGLMSALGGLSGALASQRVGSRPLEIVLAGLLLFVGVGTLAGWTRRLRFSGVWAWIAGAVSGFLGGLVGNQGGLRAGAMTGIGVSRDAFVATATATGLFVDAARLPIYVAAEARDLIALWPQIGLMTVGVLLGTYVGLTGLRRIPEQRFLQVVAVLLIGLGICLLLKGDAAIMGVRA